MRYIQKTQYLIYAFFIFFAVGMILHTIKAVTIKKYDRKTYGNTYILLCISLLSELPIIWMYRNSIAANQQEITGIVRALIFILVLLIGKRSNRLFQRGLELTTKRGRGSIRRQFFLLWKYDEKKSCTKGRHAPSCSSFHLNAARMRCATNKFARVLGCRLCCGFGVPLIRAACREVVEK